MVVQHSHDHGGGGVYALRRNAESVRLWPALERAARERANPDVGAQLNLCEWRPAPKRRRGESGVVIDMPAVVGREADMPPASDFVADGGAREIEIDEDDDEYLLSSGDEDHFLPPDRDESAVVDGSVDVGAVGEARGPASCNPRTPPASHGGDPTDAVGDVPLAPRSTPLRFSVVMMVTTLARLRIELAEGVQDSAVVFHGKGVSWNRASSSCTTARGNL